MRSAFGMIQVIFFMVIVATILSIALKYSSIALKQTSDIYIKEQAELFLQSSIELALLAIQGHDRNSFGLLKEINITSRDKRFISKINIAKYYLVGINSSERNVSIETIDSHGSVMLEVVVETNNTHPKNTRAIRVVKRTFQRP